MTKTIKAGDLTAEYLDWEIATFNGRRHPISMITHTRKGTLIRAGYDHRVAPSQEVEIHEPAI